MKTETAFEQVLSLLPEKTAHSIVDSLSSGEYDRIEVEKAVALADKLKEESFSFGKKQIDRQAVSLAKTIERLNDFLLLHYESLGGSTVILQLYPSQKHQSLLDTRDGRQISWADLRDEGLLLARAFLKEYLRLVKMCQSHVNTEVNVHRFTKRVPAGTRWEDFIFIFTEENKLRVKVKQFDETLNYESMGFADGRTGKPTIQWELLRLFAKNHGQIDPSNPDARDNYKKHKQLLSEKLQQFFGVDFDPFEPYEGAYKAKFTIFVEGE